MPDDEARICRKTYLQHLALLLKKVAEVDHRELGREILGAMASFSREPFFKDLVKFMISGPVVVQVLEGESAIAKNREVMGATNPANAAPGTIRKEFAESIEANSVHGSDAPETAANEIKFFFRDLDIVG